MKVDKLSPRLMETIQVMAECGGNVAETAAVCDVVPSTIRHRLQTIRRITELNPYDSWDLLKLVSQLYEMCERKGLQYDRLGELDEEDSKVKKFERHCSLCWDCENAVNFKICSWAREFKPVKGWTAEKRKQRYAGKTTITYKVKKCPLFEEDREYIDIRKAAS